MACIGIQPLDRRVKCGGPLTACAKSDDPAQPDLAVAARAGMVTDGGPIATVGLPRRGSRRDEQPKEQPQQQRSLHHRGYLRGYDELDGSSPWAVIVQQVWRECLSGVDLGTSPPFPDGFGWCT